jgi:hypothetical protein
MPFTALQRYALAQQIAADYPLHVNHSDLRIVPEGYEVPDSTSPLDHHDLRIKPA